MGSNLQGIPSANKWSIGILGIVLAIVVEKLGCQLAGTGHDQRSLLAVLHQDEWTVIPKGQLLTRLDDRRLAGGFRVQWTKLDPCTAPSSSKGRSIVGSQF